ncbi:MAG: response regulator [Acidobacteria bacterium]|nr:response regulator [Acidobacteriota bacterium]
MAASENSKTIMIVDDDDNIRNLLDQFFKENKYNTALAPSSIEAIQLMNIKYPDLILLDIMMPGMDGIEFAKILKNKDDTRDIPIYFITARTDSEENMQEAYSTGVEGYIKKPFKLSELLDMIKVALGDI